MTRLLLVIQMVCVALTVIVVSMTIGVFRDVETINDSMDLDAAINELAAALEDFDNEVRNLDAEVNRLNSTVDGFGKESAP